MAEVIVDPVQEQVSSRTALQEVVLAHSEVKSWPEALAEWDVVNCEYAQGNNGVCVAGHLGLFYLFHVQNRVNGEQLFPVGSECVKNFEDPRLWEQHNAHSSMLKLRTALRKGADPMRLFMGTDLFNRTLIRHLYKAEIVSFDEFLTMESLFNRRTRLGSVKWDTLAKFYDNLVGPFTEALTDVGVAGALRDGNEAFYSAVRASRECAERRRELESRISAIGRERGWWAVLPEVSRRFVLGDPLRALEVLYDSGAIRKMARRDAFPPTQYNDYDPAKDVRFVEEMVFLHVRYGSLTPGQWRKLDVLVDRVIRPWVEKEMLDQDRQIRDLQLQIERVGLEAEMSALPEERTVQQVFCDYYGISVCSDC